MWLTLWLQKPRQEWQSQLHLLFSSIVFLFKITAAFHKRLSNFVLQSRPSSPQKLHGGYAGLDKRLELAMTRKRVSYLIGALSPISDKGSQRGWTQTSIHLQVIHSTSHYTTSVFLSNRRSNSIHSFGTQNQRNNNICFGAYLYSASTQHENLHPAGWPILFCGPAQ